MQTSSNESGSRESLAFRSQTPSEPDFVPVHTWAPEAWAEGEAADCWLPAADCDDEEGADFEVDLYLPPAAVDGDFDHPFFE